MLKGAGENLTLNHFPSQSLPLLLSLHMAEAERNDPIIPAQACSPHLLFKEGEYSDGKQGPCGSQGVVCQLKRLGGLKPRQCPPPAGFFLLHLSLLSFSAFHHPALCDPAVQVQFRLRPCEIKEKRKSTKERKKINFLSGRVIKELKEAGRHIGTVFYKGLKEESKLYLDLNIKIAFLFAEEE